MIKFILKRVVTSIIMLIGVTVIVFGIIRLQPGNPFLHMIQYDTDPEFLEKKLEEIGYNDPLPMQYGKWIWRTCHLNLGYSIQYRTPVSELIADRFANTALLATASFIISTIVSICIGLLSAMYPNSIMDYIVTFLSFVGISIPVFFFGLILIKIFGYDQNILPFSGMTSLCMELNGIDKIIDIAKHMILPVAASTFTQTASLLRYTRSSILSTISEDYMQTAQEKGFTKNQAIIKHGLKNAKISIITVLCNRLPDLLSGALIIETIFVWPGIGLLNYQAILKQDYPLIMGITLLIAIIVIICNLIADTLYVIADPRIRYEK